MLASAVIAVSVGCLAACGTPTSPSPLTDQSVFPSVKASAYGLIAANPAITDQIELSTNRLPTGSPLHATLDVVNHSSRPVTLSKTCKYAMLGVLGSQTIPPRFSFRNPCESQQVESARETWRLLPLRGWSNAKEHPILPGGA